MYFRKFYFIVNNFITFNISKSKFKFKILNAILTINSLKLGL